MTRRPLNIRFADAVPSCIKTTTLRDKPWPVGVPIQLYHWLGAPYRSKQLNCAVIVVESTERIQITRTVLGLGYWKDGTDEFLTGLWRTEGFRSQADMNDWFFPLVKCGTTVDKYLMRFRLWKGADE